MGSSQQTIDCVVIGAGPSGLTAAMYLRRFHRHIAVIDDGQSRAHLIPRSHNCPGFLGGVPGTEFLQRLKAQAGDYGVTIRAGRAHALHRLDDGTFQIDDGTAPLHAPCVILATGVRDVLPSVPWAKQAIDIAAIRLCAVCDGYEASDGRIACYGPFDAALRHARFLRTFSRQVYVAPLDADSAGSARRAASSQADVTLLDGPCRLQFDGRDCMVLDARDREHRFDSLYPALGSISQSTLAAAIGARQDEQGDLVVDANQMTSVDGLYAIGDVVSALNQISVGLGHAAIAATAVHNSLPRNPR
ncbi:thioredoxin reductase (NADPH) [Luteimonas cucumeris]|uniref:Thioredoxin reductase (NADPH) n=1 Tax=Luteimonas cucumeris TaxID=985012 RepID=A0A562L263_9GAMM|nr:NAD(P)/FAD-dependent oxidoreductase [Luteimonas cucumeris]TWI01725.1 thioredoxin reductase (NADPH) [Luteimonas cucumeris]